VSYDEKNDVFVTSIVGEVIVHSKVQNPHNFELYPLLRVIFSSDTGTHDVLVTSNHPYFDPVSKTYKFIEEFKVGDAVRSIDGLGAIVSMDTIIDGTDTYEKTFIDVYNLHMKQGPSNYLVDDIVVHNKV
jgi:hypothetical protein